MINRVADLNSNQPKRDKSNESEHDTGGEIARLLSQINSLVAEAEDMKVLPQVKDELKKVVRIMGQRIQKRGAKKVIDEQNKDARHSIQNSNKQKLATLWINAGEVVLGEGLLIESRLFDKSELLEEIKVVRSSVESVNQSIEKKNGFPNT